MPKEADSSSGIALDIRVEAGDWPSRAKLKGLVERSLTAAVAKAKLKLAPEPELSLLFTDDAHIRVLNKRYRRKDKPTNVLSFPAPAAVRGKFGPQLGDLVFAAETIAGEAERDGISLNDHLAHLVVHGFLHLLGHDHEDESEATVMENLETSILARLGIADPYGGEAA
ncbi:MAG TPA: rRNA maturation RNase YbeY [Bauldia sp.]|nr:rRNA maturation RNase YbeY [Bauldia sp.]